MCLLVRLVIWHEISTNATKKLLYQWRIGVLRYYFIDWDAQTNKKRTALVHIISQPIAENEADGYLLNDFKSNSSSWSFGMTAEVLLFEATLLYLTCTNFKVVETPQLKVQTHCISALQFFSCDILYICFL